MNKRLPAASILGCILVLGVSHVAAQQGSPAANKPSPAGNRPPSATQKAQVRSSAWTAEVLKLLQAGVEDALLLAFVDAAGTFNLDADQIISLRDAGASPAVISTIIRHDAEIAQNLRPLPATTPPSLDGLLPLIEIASPSQPAVEKPATPAQPSAEVAARVTSTEPATLDGGSIVMDSGSPQILFEDASVGPELQYAPDPGDAGELARDSSTPVRQPFPVALTNPIIVVRAEARRPNLQLLQPFP